MSFFTNKLLHKKPWQRKFVKSDLNFEEINRPTYNEITLTLDEVKAVFCEGHWIYQFQSQKGNNQEPEPHKSQINQLKEENNLLKLKCEILLDMLTQKSVSPQQ